MVRRAFCADHSRRCDAERSQCGMPTRAADAKAVPGRAAGWSGLLRALRGPFPEVGFVPTGGITPHNLGDYARQPNVVACGGSWIASREAISARKFDEIVAAAQEASTILRGAHEAA